MLRDLSCIFEDRFGCVPFFFFFSVADGTIHGLVAAVRDDSRG